MSTYISRSDIHNTITEIDSVGSVGGQYVDITLVAFAAARNP